MGHTFLLQGTSGSQPLASSLSPTRPGVPTIPIPKYGKAKPNMHSPPLFTAPHNLFLRELLLALSQYASARQITSVALNPKYDCISTLPSTTSEVSCSVRTLFAMQSPILYTNSLHLHIGCQVSLGLQTDGLTAHLGFPECSAEGFPFQGWGPGGDQKSLRLCSQASASVRNRPRVSCTPRSREMVAKRRTVVTFGLDFGQRRGGKAEEKREQRRERGEEK